MSITPSVYAKARAETAKLLGYGDDIDGLTPEQVTRLDVACALRIALDDQAAKLLRGESTDVSKLLSTSEALGRLLPPAVLASPPSEPREDPRQVMWEIYKQMRERGEIGLKALPPKGDSQHRIDELEAENERLKARLAGKTLEHSDVPTVVEGVPSPAGNVVPLAQNPSSPAPAPAAPHYNANQDWKNFVEPDGSIRSTPRGRGHYWGPV